MNKQEVLGWGLGSLAVAVGYVQWGWQGVVLAVTLVVFWLLLQFSRGVRSLREAAGAPVGSVRSAVMLHSRLQAGMNLPGNKALWVILIPILVIVVLCCVIFAGLFGLLAIVSSQTSP